MAAFDASENRSWDVRRSAQAHLRALRADRLRRREAARTPSADGPAGGPMEPESAFDVRIPADTARPAAMEDDGTTIDATVDAAIFVEMDDAAEAIDADDVDSLIDCLAQPAAAGPSDAEGSGATEQADADPAEPEADPGQDHAARDAGRALSADSELLVLPGIGPGLIWLLERAGIRTLNDLAHADPAALRAELGLVGDLLDIDYWIGMAGR